jgi:predicted acetyltransferase
MKERINIRPIGEDEFETWSKTLALVFAFDQRPEDREVWARRVEMDRCIGAFDGKDMVGTSGALSYRMAVPGGDVVPAAGVTAVSVMPSHRRRGLLRSMMGELLDDACRRQECLAVLWASESAIYGRFGWGAAIEGTDLMIERPYAALRQDVPYAGQVRIVGEEEARSLLPGIYERATAGIPGTVLRNQADWDEYFYDPEHWREGASAVRFAVLEDGGDLRGFVRYRQRATWEEAHAKHMLHVEDLLAVDGAGYAALWRFCIGIDLVATIKAHNCRLNEPLPLLLADPRRLQRIVADKIWLRILDVERALSARRYAVEGEVVLEVRDDFLPDAQGRFLLRGGPDGAECSPTDADPALTISTTDLAAAYLGDSRIRTLGWLGRVQGEPEVIERAHRMFEWPVEPWCTVFF